MKAAFRLIGTRMPTWARGACLIAGLGSLLALGWALAWYALAPALSAALVAVVLLALSARRRGLSLAVLAPLAGTLIWWSFGTTEGYFSLNQRRLERLVADIQAVPAMTSLDLGQEGAYLDPIGGSSSQPGRLHVYDTYRFINGTVVTHFREQAAPEAHQPVLYVEDMLQSLHVPADRYWHLRRSLERLSLGGYSLDPAGQVALSEPPVGGQPWGYGFVFSPAGEAPWSNGVQEARELAPNWFYVMWG